MRRAGGGEAGLFSMFCHRTFVSYTYRSGVADFGARGSKVSRILIVEHRRILSVSMICYYFITDHRSVWKKELKSWSKVIIIKLEQGNIIELENE